MLDAALDPYRTAVLCAAGVAALHFVQLLIADLFAIVRKHPPGTPVLANHGDFLFRAVRAHANTTEGLATFALLLFCAVALGARPSWVNLGALVYLLGRGAHMLCYYGDWRLLRSGSFGVSLVGQAALLAALLRTLV